MGDNPLLSDRDIDFLLEMLEVGKLCELPAFHEHSRETFQLFIDSARRLGRQVLFPTYKPMDEAPPVLRDGKMFVHPRLKEIYPQLVDLGVITATRSADVGGQQIPMTVATLAFGYLMAGNPG